jgi:hypothetical protein
LSRLGSKRTLISRIFSKHRFGALQILFRIHANRVARRIGNINRNAVFEKPQLLQALQLFKRRGRQRGEALQRGLAIGIDAEMLAIAGEPPASRSKGIVAREK